MTRSYNHATDYKKDIKEANPGAERSYRFKNIVGESDHAGRQSLDNKRGASRETRRRTCCWRGFLQRRRRTSSRSEYDSTGALAPPPLGNFTTNCIILIDTMATFIKWVLPYYLHSLLLLLHLILHHLKKNSKYNTNF